MFTGVCPDWFVKQQHIEVWGDDVAYCDDDKLIGWQEDYQKLIGWEEDYQKLIGWHEDYQKRKTQKTQIKKELIPIAWNPDRVMDWCMAEDEKRSWK